MIKPSDASVARTRFAYAIAMRGKDVEWYNFRHLRSILTPNGGARGITVATEITITRRQIEQTLYEVTL